MLSMFSAYIYVTQKINLWGELVSVPFYLYALWCLPCSVLGNNKNHTQDSNVIDYLNTKWSRLSLTFVSLQEEVM